MNIMAIRGAKKSKKIEVLMRELFGNNTSDGKVLDIQLGLRKLQYFTFNCTESGVVRINLGGSREDNSNVIINNEDGVVKLAGWYNAYDFISDFLGIYNVGRPANKFKMAEKYPLIFNDKTEEKEELDAYANVATDILRYMKVHLCN